MCLLVCGHNGSGKSTFARALSEGTVSQFFVVTQITRSAPPVSAWTSADVINFADPIRAAVAAEFGIDPGAEFDAVKDMRRSPASPASSASSASSTPRDRMIELATAARITDDSHWADIAVSRATGPRTIFGDFRFAVEHRVVRAAAEARGIPFAVARIAHEPALAADPEAFAFAPDYVVHRAGAV